MTGRAKVDGTGLRPKAAGEGSVGFAADPIHHRGHSDLSQLLRILGIGFGVAVVVGGTVGQGILRMPGLVASGLPDPRLILAAWILGGMLALLDSMSTVELATSIRKAGGPYAFANRAFGPVPGFLVGASDWLANTSATAVVSVAFAEFCHRFAFASSIPLGVIAALLICGCGVINWIGTRTSGMSQNIGSVLKAGALLIIVATLLLAPASGDPLMPADPLPVLSLAGVVIAARAIHSTYSGWNTASYFCEEVHAPERNIARATFMGIFSVMIIYVAVNVALLHVLPVEAIAASKLPASDAVNVVAGPVGALMVTMFAIISVAAIANLQIMFLSRVLYGMSRDNMLPAAFRRVSRSGTPRVSLLLSVAVAALLASTGGYEDLLAVYAVLSAMTYVCVNVAAIALRLREPDLPRPYRMPLFPLPALLALGANGTLLVFLLIEGPTDAFYALLMLSAFFLLYLSSAAFMQRREPLANPATK